MDRARHPKILVVMAFVVLGSLGVAACGGDDSGGAQRNQIVKATGGKVTVDAHDIYFNAKEIDTTPGRLAVTLDNEGAVLHTFVIDRPKFKIGANAGKSATGTVTLEEGRYVYYCDVPGHRATMHGTLVVR